MLFVTILIITLTASLLLDKYRVGWMHPKRFMFHGSVRDKGRGVPRCLYQKKETTKLAVAQAKWTLKVSTLKGYAAIPGNVALSLYDSKPLYFMSNACEEVKWN